MKLAQDELLKRINNKCKIKNYTFIKFINYISTTSNLLIKCNNDNHEWKVNYKSFIYYSTGCPKCARNLAYTKDELLKKINDKCEIKNYTLLDILEFKGNKTKIKLKCNKDNYEWYTDFHTFIDSDCGCKRCYGNIPLTKNEYMNNIHKKCLERKYTYLDLDKWVGNKTHIKLRCNNDNYEWKIRYDSFISNNIGCPKCADKSKYIEILDNKLNKLNIKFIKEKTYNNLKYINLLRFDYYLINQNALIELDGNEHKNKNSRTYFTDKIKEKYCIDNNLKLIRIDNKIVKNANINEILNKNNIIV